MRGRTRARTEAAENVESFWKAVFLFLTCFSTSVSQLLRQNKREIETKGMRPFSSDQAAIAVNEAEKIEAKTVKDTECQTIEF